MTIERVELSHGSGDGNQRLLSEVVLPNLVPDRCGPLEDSAVVPSPGACLAFTTDSFVVQPLEFPGGDIGKLAACGTLNDLAVMGARPVLMSVALILEEGLDAGLLARVLRSLSAVCKASGVAIVCGDTKVVQHGKADGMFVTTAGIGVVPEGRSLSAANARPGDAVLVSGPIGCHGIAIMAQRANLGFASSVASDCAPIQGLTGALLEAVPGTKVMRDATRGGCAAVLNEIALDSGVTIRLRLADIPVGEGVTGACNYLGLDPLQVANEGTFVAVVPGSDAARALVALKAASGGSGAAIIGAVEAKGRFPVVAVTEIGGTRPVEMPLGRLLPRIC